MTVKVNTIHSVLVRSAPFTN